ncbi:hypothetical protein GF380_01385 [Candidatus Uhrbacteria bacterium]|nr:hypothetical protein [Candidatus Uhrbacteria bacterium]MBD3283932.1 hypothetical protein [Candidatus Uhrbacteria bacterium]
MLRGSSGGRDDDTSRAKHDLRDQFGAPLDVYTGVGNIWLPSCERIYGYILDQCPNEQAMAAEVAAYLCLGEDEPDSFANFAVGVRDAWRLARFTPIWAQYQAQVKAFEAAHDQRVADLKRRLERAEGALREARAVVHALDKQLNICLDVAFASSTTDDVGKPFEGSVEGAGSVADDAPAPGRAQAAGAAGDPGGPPETPSSAPPTPSPLEVPGGQMSDKDDGIGPLPLPEHLQRIVDSAPKLRAEVDSYFAAAVDRLWTNPVLRARARAEYFEHMESNPTQGDIPKAVRRDVDFFAAEMRNKREHAKP